MQRFNADTEIKGYVYYWYGYESLHYKLDSPDCQYHLLLLEIMVLQH